MELHSDHQRYFGFTAKSRIDKAIQSLIGAIEGISMDGAVTEKEITYLSQWIEQYEDVADRHPFNELLPVVKEAISDGVLDESEKEDILWLCRRLSPGGDGLAQVAADIRQLHGILGGILADGVVAEDELRGLLSWLADHEHLKTCWPYDEIESIVTAVMVDGVITAGEQQALQALFAEFVQIENDRTITNPVAFEGEKLVGLCAVCPEICFDGTVFCFTGASSRFKRTELKGIVEQLGGKFTDSLTKAVNYLVIGADGNPCWMYACYGRKVEAAVALRKQGHKLLLVHENDLHDAVADAGL